LEALLDQGYGIDPTTLHVDHRAPNLLLRITPLRRRRQAGDANQT
jgi:hypothetical protein